MTRNTKRSWTATRQLDMMCCARLSAAPANGYEIARGDRVVCKTSRCGTRHSLPRASPREKAAGCRKMGDFLHQSVRARYYRTHGAGRQRLRTNARCGSKWPLRSPRNAAA